MNEERGAQAQSIHERIVKNEEMRRSLIAENAQLLNLIYKEGLYKELLGDENAPWAGYLANIEIYYTRSRINYLVRLYERFSVELGIDKSIWIQAPPTRLMDVLHIIDKDNYEDWISKSLVLTSRDWLIECRKAKGLLTEEDDHEHAMETYDVCKRCGKKEKHHHDNDTDQSSQENTK